MKTQTSELTGQALDWAVAQCKGRVWESVESFIDYHDDEWMNYSTKWAQGGPIIEQEKISVSPEYLPGSGWVADTRNISEKTHQYGPTALVAAMRCYVASKLGDEVDVPDELINEGEIK
jgi:hypothetical protein